MKPIKSFECPTYPLHSTQRGEGKELKVTTWVCHRCSYKGNLRPNGQNCPIKNKERSNSPFSVRDLSTGNKEVHKFYRDD